MSPCIYNPRLDACTCEASYGYFASSLGCQVNFAYMFFIVLQPGETLVITSESGHTGSHAVMWGEHCPRQYTAGAGKCSATRNTCIGAGGTAFSLTNTGTTPRKAWHIVWINAVDTGTSNNGYHGTWNWNIAPKVEWRVVPTSNMSNVSSPLTIMGNAASKASANPFYLTQCCTGQLHLFFVELQPGDSIVITRASNTLRIGQASNWDAIDARCNAYMRDTIRFDCGPTELKQVVAGEHTDLMTNTRKKNTGLVPTRLGLCVYILYMHT